jgi:hypothetical protein
MVARTLAVMCTPVLGHTAASLTMTDLRAELKHRRSGEDGRTTIEHQRERPCNLDEHYDTLNVIPAGQATHPTSSLGASARCMALAPHLRMVVWPHKFWPHLLKKYNGTINPSEFLQIYSTTIFAAGGNEVVMANYFPVALTDTT